MIIQLVKSKSHGSKNQFQKPSIMKIKVLFIVAAIYSLSCNQSTSTNEKAGSDSTSNTNEKELIQTAKDAYLFGYPLVVMSVTSQVMTNVVRPDNNGRLAAPINQLVNANVFPDDKFRDVVRPNSDTYYSTCTMDLSAEPLVLESPNTNGRYFLLPLYDAWSNVFFSPGKRTTGTNSQKYLLAGPGWKGEEPKGFTLVKAPTSLIFLIGRTQVNSKEDGAITVKEIQDGYKITPLSKYGRAYIPPMGKVDSTLPKKTPNDVVTSMSISDYFNLLNKLMVDNPPSAADSSILKKLATIGVGPGAVFDLSKFSAMVQDSLKAIPALEKQNLLNNGLGKSKPINGWNIDRGLGSYGTNYEMRAAVAYNGLFANLDADAIYPNTMIDVNGNKLDGSAHKYLLHFDAGKFPPSNAFWSLTMYNMEGFFISNPINRFAIGDRNPLKKNADGSIDIYIQKDNPGKDKQNNWLPAPNGPFNLLLRIYWPKEEMTSGAWNPPGVALVK